MTGQVIESLRARLAEHREWERRAVELLRSIESVDFGGKSSYLYRCPVCDGGNLGLDSSTQEHVDTCELAALLSERERDDLRNGNTISCEGEGPKLETVEIPVEGQACLQTHSGRDRKWLLQYQRVRLGSR
jgi:hypothetical protein